jgi:hypothetical protein
MVKKIDSKTASGKEINLKLVPKDSTIINMNSKHKRTLSDIYAKPVRTGIVWADIEAMLIALGAEVSEGNGSRVRIALNGVRSVFHRPHPQKETDKGAVVCMRRFLEEAGIKP